MLLLVAIPALLCLHPEAALAASKKRVEIKPFGVIDTNAKFSVRYLLDERDLGESTAGGVFEDRATWEQELWFNTRSYVYHPAFLNIHFDLGPKLVQQDFESNAGANDNDEDFLQFRTRLNFLQLKSYPFSIYYNRTNPSVTAGLSGRFLAERNEYGLQANFPLPGNTLAKFDLTHRDNLGLGFDRVVDDEEDGGSITLRSTYRGGDSIEIKHGQSIRDSSTGSPGLPIQKTRNRQDRSQIVTRNQFGSDRRHSLSQHFVRLAQELGVSRPSELDDWSYNSTLQLLHSDRWSSFADVGLSEMRRAQSTSERNSANLGAAYLMRENLRFDLRVNRNSVNQTGFESDRTGFNFSSSYYRDFALGRLSIGADAGNSRTDQVSSADTVQVFDEAVVLVGTVPVTLANEFVIAASVVVSNTDRTQVFIEGVDYRLVEVGSFTRIQRLLNSNILDGETVLVDYEYRTSGTAEFDTTNSNLNLTFSLPKYVTASVRYSRRDTDLERGEFTTPINDGDSLEFVLDADVKLGRSWNINGQLRHQDRNEEISPSVTDSVSVNANAAVSRSLSLNMGGRLLRIDIEGSREDVDEVQFLLGLTARPRSQIRMSYDVSLSRDIGGSLNRETFRHRLQFNWRYRAVLFSLRADVSDESLGATDRQFRRVTAELTRIF